MIDERQLTVDINLLQRRSPREDTVGATIVGPRQHPTPSALHHRHSSQDQKAEWSRNRSVSFRTYGELNLDESPVVVLGCGHFFTAESVDGLAGLRDVYSADPVTGRFDGGLLEPAALLPVPCCPDCKRPMRQSAIVRYNRVVKAAVLDETSQRFLVKGLCDLRSLEERIDVAESTLEIEAGASSGPSHTSTGGPRRRTAPVDPVADRYHQLRLLEREVSKFCKATSDEQQPAKKLFDAVTEATALRRMLEVQRAEGGRHHPDLNTRMGSLSLERRPPTTLPTFDQLTRTKPADRGETTHPATPPVHPPE
ncbi:hypothetical protein GE09DRAFT_1192887 [Coniochaeta sp. 2T2.1]|nr:hypothetical protein GE09DRAFT_1192887 [Coniochaeta sp. 2T2.1]